MSTTWGTIKKSVSSWNPNGKECKVIFFIIIPVSLLILLAIYFYYYLKRIGKFFKIDTCKKQVKCVIIAILIFLFAGIFIWSTIVIVLLHIFFITLCLDAIRILFHKKSNRNDAFWNRIYRSGLLSIFITASILCYGLWNMGNVVETEYTVHTQKSIRTQGYRIAMISDLHYGSIIQREKLEHISNEIENANPDIVVLCGDIIDESTTLEEMRESFEILSNIKSKYGVIYIYGNHDLSTYSANQLNNALADNGIHLLVDESYEINDDFVIIGREDAGYSLDSNRKSGTQLIQNIDREKFILLLDHQPIELQNNSKLGYDLQLSGHTHAGQIWPSGLVGELLGLMEVNYGYEKIGEFQVIVSSGIAGWGFPIRTELHSEFVIITII